jgi:protoheme IX farnesyltransferase
MDTYTIELNKELESNPRALNWRGRFVAYLELTKPRIALTLLLTAAAGFYLGTSGVFDFWKFFHAMVGIALLAFGVATFNQLIERDTDRLMKRTANRPLPSGKLKPAEVLVFAVFLCLAAEIYLAYFVNPLTSVMGILVIIGYVMLYTPMKTRTSLSTVVGAFPGAMPPLMGWTSSTNEITLGAWILFVLLFLWQFPHFLAIAWMYREEYANAKILMLPVVEPEGRITARQIVIFSILTFITSLFPFFLGLSGFAYLTGAIVLGILFCWSSIRAAKTRSLGETRRLFLVSVLYLPLLFGLMVLNH